ncbi:MAG: TetR family transcriptional regulator, partial [Deltaproteobacteria bacterium]
MRAPKKDTADRILAAADELFCRVGYDAVSVRDVAERAGVNKALVFYHFESKAVLFERVLTGYYAAHRRALAEAFEADGTPRERMHRMADAYLDFMIGNARYAVLAQQQISNPETHPLVEKNLEPLYRWIEHALSEIAPHTGPGGARQLFVTFSGLVINYFTYTPLLARMWDRDPLG